MISITIYESFLTQLVLGILSVFAKIRLANRIAVITMTLLALSCFLVAPPAVASFCPFCSAINLTFAEQLGSNDVVVVAKLLEIPPPSNDPDADFPKAQFEIEQVIKGKDFVAPKMIFRTQLVGTYPLGQKFLVMGVDPPKLAWTTPMKASDRVFKYLHDIQTLPASGPQRLQFFQNFFEDKESILAFDAYDEFARAPYEDLIAMKDLMHHDKLIDWIRDPETSVNRRRLYFTMLGVCGTEKDILLLEELIRSGDRQKMAGLDALIACYLTLKGTAGVDLIEETFLVDPDVEYIDANAAVSALRFHGTETDSIPKERIVSAVRHLLDRPKYADMIIPDLARWEDWSVMDRLVQMFKDAEDDSNWLRVPVIAYLRACPKPEAKVYIEELAKIDPDAVRRADFFLGGFDDDDAGDEDTQDAPLKAENSEPEATQKADEVKKGPAEKPADSSVSPSDAGNTELNGTANTKADHVVLKIPVDSPVSTAANLSLDSTNTAVDAEIEIPVSAEKTETKSTPSTNRLDSVFVSNASTSSASPVPVAEVVPQISSPAPIATITSSNLTWSIIFVPMGVSLVIFLLLWSVVNGWFERLIF